MFEKKKNTNTNKTTKLKTHCDGIPTAININQT